MPNPKTPDLFVKIHGSEQVAENRMMLDVEIISLGEDGDAVAHQPVEVEMNGKKQRLTTDDLGRFRGELIFPIRAGVREKLLTRVYGSATPSEVTEIVPQNFENVLETRVAERKDAEFAVREEEIQAAISGLQKQLLSKDELLQQKEETNAGLAAQINALRKRVDQVQTSETCKPLLSDFISLVKQIPESRAQLERDNKEKVADFYKDLLRNIAIPSISEFTVAELEEKIKKVIEDLKAYICKIISLIDTNTKLKNIDVEYLDLGQLKDLLGKPIGPNFRFTKSRYYDYKHGVGPYNVEYRTDHYLSIGGCTVFTVRSYTEKEEQVRSCIDPDSIVKKWNSMIDIVDKHQTVLGCLQEFLKSAHHSVDKNSIAKAAKQKNAIGAIETTISLNKEKFLTLYRLLYPKENFSKIEEVIAFEIKRYEGIAFANASFSGELAESILAQAAEIEKYLSAGNFPLAWKAFEDAVKLVKSNPHLAKLVNLEKFEAEWGDYISAFHKRFSADGFGDQLPVVQKKKK
jgi:hypothetical protein